MAETPERFGMTPLDTGPADPMRAVRNALRRQANPAGYAFERLRDLIARFEGNLNPDQEVGMLIVAGPVEPFHVTGMSRSNPDLLIFEGVTSAGDPVTLVQHHTQLNFQLVALKKQDEQPRRIGFTAEM